MTTTADESKPALDRPAARPGDRGTVSLPDVEIKPLSVCPLCGHPPEIIRIHDEFLVECSACLGPDEDATLLPLGCYDAQRRLVDAVRIWQLQCQAERRRIEVLKTRSAADVR